MCGTNDVPPRQYIATGPILGLGLTPNALPDAVFAGKVRGPAPAPGTPNYGEAPERWADASAFAPTAHNLKLSQVQFGFDPSSISGLCAWWDASDTTTITASGGAVSQWNDKSATGCHLTQSTGGRQPSTGTRTLNG